MSMNEDLYGEVAPRRVVTVFLLVDASGSMEVNGNIGKVNGAIEEMIPLLQEDAPDGNADAEIRVAVLSFNDNAQWVTFADDARTIAGPSPLPNFAWNDVEAVGITEMGEAFLELESKLSRSAFLNYQTGAFAPVIVLLSDGYPTDRKTPWRDGLEKLKKNNWYRAATKIAIAVDGAKDEPLAEFTGDPALVLKVDSNRDDLKKLLRTVAAVSSKIQSRSVSAGVEGDDEQIANQTGKDVVDTVTAQLGGTSGADPDPWATKQGGW